MQRFVIQNVQIDNNKKAAENYISSLPPPPILPHIWLYVARYFTQQQQKIIRTKRNV